ncbi:flagellar hook assembly protein FlgD [Paucidesulfovibrio longus]|uniref:flagellar hook assembly protein FlgD n=1 Tax=Paucidesulfovibrio longus TaxID=889 RepID=UPI0003B3F6B5|nr:flagellar hook capping FlgD N-terminal domain-containing protein [Paucidesulfovibrio longus]
MSLEAIISSTTNTTTVADGSSSTLDSDAFLQLLLTEIEYQDPLDPMDNTEYVAQLAQLSSLEQLTSISSGMDDVLEAVGQQTSTTALFYLGATVEAEGDSITLEDGEAETMTFILADDASSVTANVYGSDGSIVSSVLLGELDSGSYTFAWDGTNAAGVVADDGEYTVAFSAEDEDGASVDVSTTISGVVSGVETTSSGVELTLADGRTVALSDITSVSF